jgi:glycine/D-amino acid oxidase-like deaminating enzyme
LSTPNFDVAIVGAGIVGSACALQSARAGLTTALIEQGVEGGGATGAGMGHILATDDSEAQFALTRFGQRLWREIAPSLPSSSEWSDCGTIWIAASDNEMSMVALKHKFYVDHDVPAEILDREQLSHAEPNVRPGLAGGLRLPEDGVVYPPSATAYFLACAKEMGAQIFRGKRASSIGHREIRLDDGECVHAAHIIVAAGTATTDFGTPSKIRPRKGHLLITDRYPGFVRHQLVELGYLKSAHDSDHDSVAFNIQPRPTGQCLIGSSRQYDTPDSEIDGDIVAQITRRALEFMPHIGALKVTRIWTGQRASTPDNLPLLGPTRTDPTMYMASGHGGLGITTSLASATLIVDHIRGRESSIPITPYLPSRWDAPE